MLMIEERLLAARAHIAAGRRDSAGLILESVIEINPGHPEALRCLAETRLSQGKAADAMTLASMAAQREPANIDGLALLARIALLAGHADVAAAALDQGFATEPTHADICMIKANLLTVAGEFSAAEILLGAALGHHPGHGGILSALAQFYVMSGAVAPALDYAQRANDADPDNPVLLGRLGLQLAGLGDHAHAIPYLERAYLLDPADPLVAMQLSDSLNSCGAPQEARRAAERLIALHPEFLPGWECWVRVMIHAGQMEVALARFASVAQRHSERIAALLALAGCYRVAGRPDDSLRLLAPITDRINLLPPEHRLKAHSLLRDCCLSTGEIERMRQVLPLFDPDDADVGQAFAEATIVIDRGFSSLEALVLLRFAPRQGAIRTIRGAASLADLVALIPGTDFSADDLPKDDVDSQTIRAFPLSAVLSLPELPAALSTPQPYIEAASERRAVWRRSLADLPRPLLGIAWDQSRPGLLLDDLRPVLSAFRGTLVSLIWDEGRQQLAAWPEIIDAGTHFSSLADLAAVIAEIDGVIAPDGLAAHIAGGMGRAGCVLSLPNPPWYWHSAAGRSTWYPSIQVLATQQFGNWAHRLGDLAENITAFADHLQEIEEQDR